MFPGHTFPTFRLVLRIGCVHVGHLEALSYTWASAFIGLRVLVATRAPSVEPERHLQTARQGHSSRMGIFSSHDGDYSWASKPTKVAFQGSLPKPHIVV